MLPATRRFILTTLSALAILLFCPALQANQTSFVNLTANNYSGIGPYGGNFQSLAPPSTGTIYYTGAMFCLTGNISYSGSVQGSYSSLAELIASPPANLAQDEEAAFLASYALSRGASPTGNDTLPSSSSILTTVDSPTQYAIWTIMNTLPSGGVPTAFQAATNLLVTEAKNAYKDGLIKNTPSAPSYLSQVYIWTPTGGGSQSFVTLVNNPDMIHSAVPEPGTMIFMATGVLLMALGRIRRRR
jgi:hypothetical protein